MIRQLTFAFAIGCGLSLCGCHIISSIAPDSVSGSGVEKTEPRALDQKFTKISDDGVANVSVVVGPAISVKVQGDDNIVPLVTTKIEDDTLVIKTKKNVDAKKKLVVFVTMPALEGVELNGVATVHVQKYSGDDLSLSLDGAGKIIAEGTAKTVNASLDGAGSMDLKALESDSSSVSVDGAGNVDLWAKKNLTASIDGVGSIHYKGDPQVTQSISGVGSVEKMSGK